VRDPGARGILVCVGVGREMVTDKVSVAGPKAVNDAVGEYLGLPLLYPGYLDISPTGAIQ
jgi:hypothetical protein